MKGKAEAVFDDDLIVTVRGRGTAREEFENVEGVYADAYVEAPYNEGPDSVAEFVQSWPYRMAQPSFRIVVARLKEDPIGCTFGHQLVTTTRGGTGCSTQSTETSSLSDRTARSR